MLNGVPHERIEKEEKQMYRMKSRVRYSETDSKERLALRAVTDYFQDVCTFQSEDLGLGVEYLKQENLAWVLSAWQVVIEEYPLMGEEIEIGTFPYAFKGFIGFRNFLMQDKNGRRLAWANSVWTLLDTRSMNPARPTEKMLERYVRKPRLEEEYAPRKIAVPKDGRTFDPIDIMRWQIDGNQHVNNGRYVEMAAEYVPKEEQIVQMRAEYKRQAKLGEKIVPVLVVQKQQYIVSLCDTERKPYAVVEFLTKKRQADF